jgi:hypothetical protein
MAIELSDVVEDKITGFAGTVTGISEYLHGCRQVCVVASKLGSDGKTVVQWFDEQRLKAVNKKTGKPKATSGGPQELPPVTS